MQKLTIDKFTDQGVTCLKLSGWIDEDFDGQKLAQTVHAKTLVLHLANIRRISSFGIREWVDFIGAVAKSTERIILVECAPKVIDQLNMVANFIGPGLIFSFYAPYRCDYCDSENAVLMQVDRDWPAISTMKPPERPCPSCGDVEYFDEDPVTYFSYVVSQGKFELDPDVAALLSSKLSHSVSHARQRLRVDKAIEGEFTYLKLSGDLDASFPRIKLAEGLEGAVIIDLASLGRIEPAGAAEWRSFLQIITISAQSIYLLGVPPTFLEKLTSREDLGPRAQVATIALPYSCSKCASTAPYVVNVFSHFDVLKFATPPEMRCHDCKSPAYCSASESLLSHLPSLPKPNVSPEVRKFIKSMKDRKVGGRKATSMKQPQVTPRAGGSSWLMVLAAAVLAAALSVGGVIGYGYLYGRDETATNPDGVGQRLEASATSRPAWVTSDTPFSGYCNTGAELGLSCVGVSSYTTNEADGRDEAKSAVYEALVHALGPRINHEDWGKNIAAIFTDARQAKISMYADQRDRESIQYDRAYRGVRDGRKAVASALRETGGQLLPSAPTGQYWERYQASTGRGHRYLVFLQYQLPGEVIDKLVEIYSIPVSAEGSEAMTAFPGIAWRFPDIDRGAVITDLGDGALKSMGLAERYIVLSIQDRVVKDGRSFARILTEEMTELRKNGGTLRLQVKTGDTLPMEFSQPVVKGAPPAAENSKKSRKPTPKTERLRGPVNTWDRVGGGETRGNLTQ